MASQREASVEGAHHRTGVHISKGQDEGSCVNAYTTARHIRENIYGVLVLEAAMSRKLLSLPVSLGTAALPTTRRDVDVGLSQVKVAAASTAKTKDCNKDISSMHD